MLLGGGEQERPLQAERAAELIFPPSFADF